jgi:hypothetical protein
VRKARIIIHGLVLTVVNVGAVLFGFACYKASGLPYQLPIQISVAALCSAGAFLVWSLAVGRVFVDEYSPCTAAEFLGVFLLSLLWLPVLFVPGHYFTQGYLTSFSNIYYMWLFQAPLNAVTLFLVYRLRRRRLPR